MTAYISEISITDEEDGFIEVAVPAGTDASGYTIAVYGTGGELQTTVSLGSVDGTMFGSDVYVTGGGGIDFEELEEGGGFALIDGDGNVVQFVSIGGGTVTATDGPAAGSSSTNIGTIDEEGTLETSDGGATYVEVPSSTPGTIPCYAPGTMIDTPDGPRAVETLACGDLVTTLDHGSQPVMWIRRATHALEDGSDDNRPVLIKAGALGGGRPKRDLIVSPQHRILVGGYGQLNGFFHTQAFAPAKSLTGLPGIRFMRGRKSIEWIHFACPAHEVVFAAGVLSESLLLGQMVMQGLPARDRAGLRNIFGRSVPGFALNGPAARDCLTVGQVRKILHQNCDSQRLAA